jgi:uncharacterized membrane protein YkvA (DUF1232 family)
MQKMISNMKNRARLAKTELAAVYFAYKNPKLNYLPKAIIALAIAYALSPIDLIPDFIPIIGYLDDLIIVPALITLAIKLIPLDIMKESREKAETEPLTLKNNWIFAILFLIVWLVVAYGIIRSIIHMFK